MRGGRDLSSMVRTCRSSVAAQHALGPMEVVQGLSLPDSPFAAQQFASREASCKVDAEHKFAGALLQV